MNERLLSLEQSNENFKNGLLLAFPLGTLSLTTNYNFFSKSN
jgi:hypothetical protein